MDKNKTATTQNNTATTNNKTAPTPEAPFKGVGGLSSKGVGGLSSTEVGGLQILIGNTLRWGVTIACLLAAAGGAVYLWRHGSEPMPDYTHFSYNDPACHPSEYTTLEGIFQGMLSGVARSWIQLGVIVLLLTPIMRVILSLFDFILEHDWLYAFITAVVLGVIISNSLQLF